MATGRRVREGIPPRRQEKIAARTPARGNQKRTAAVAVATLLLCVIVVGGVLWLARQQAAPGAATGGVPAGQLAPGAGIALPSTQGTRLSLAGFHGHKVVLYFYEEAT